MEHGGIEEILRTRKFPGVHGVSDGPGSSANEMVYSRPDREKETRMTLKRMEEDGKFKGNPELLYAAKVAMAEAQSSPKEKIDYDKGWHPLESRNSVDVDRGMIND